MHRWVLLIQSIFLRLGCYSQHLFWFCWFALHILHLQGKPSDIAGQMLASLIIAMMFWAIVRLTASADILWGRFGASMDESVRRWLGFSVRILVLITGGAIILQIWHIPVAPLIGSLGVFGIGVGLAAKDLFGNLISGLLIMTEKRFGVGDWIKVDGVVNGTVEEVNFRSTRVRAFDLTPIYVPNSALADNAMTNYSRMTYRRIYWTVGLKYGTAPDGLKQIRDRVDAWLRSDERICQPPDAALFVRIDNFGESSINLMLYCFTRTTAWDEWLKIKEDFALAIIPIVEAAGSGFALPARSVFLQHIDPPEIVDPLKEANA